MVFVMVCDSLKNTCDFTSVLLMYMYYNSTTYFVQRGCVIFTEFSKHCAKFSTTNFLFISLTSKMAAEENVVKQEIHDKVVEELRQVREDAVKAAQAGHDLLLQLGEVRAERDKALQDVHQHKREQEASLNMVANLQDELDKIKDDHGKLMEAKDNEIEAFKKKRLESVESLRLAQNKFDQEIATLREANNTQNKQIEVLKVELENVHSSVKEAQEPEVDHDKVEVLNCKLQEVCEQKLELERAQEMLMHENAELLDKVHHLQEDLGNVKAALEEANCEMLGYQQSLTQIKDEMAHLTESDLGDAAERKGNSLFSEVDDRRKIVEVKLKSIMSKYDKVKMVSDMKAKQLAKTQMQYVALLSKRSTGETSGATAKHLEDLLMREKAKNSALEQKLSTSGGGKADVRVQEQIKQTVIAEDMLMAANKTVAKLETSERYLKAEVARLKYEIESLKENAKASDFQPKSGGIKETLNFAAKQSPPQKETSDERIVLEEVTSRPKEANVPQLPHTKPDEKKKARFADDVTTHEYVETEVEKKAKSRVVSKAVDADEETARLQNECKQQ